jgi:transposase-like protein
MSRTTNRFSPEVRERAVRLVLDNEHEHASRWATIESIAAKIGCVPQTLLEWVKKTEINAGKRAGVPTEMAGRMKALEREVRELRQANEIPRKASAYFAQGITGTGNYGITGTGYEITNPLASVTIGTPHHHRARSDSVQPHVSPVSHEDWVPQSLVGAKGSHSMCHNSAIRILSP